MPIVAILAAISAGMDLLPKAISMGANVATLIQRMKKVADTDPNAITQEDLDAIQTENDALRKEVEDLEARA